MKWYAINPEDAPMLPPLEDYESGLSVDVLVFGFFNNVARQPFFGIGYWQGYREGTWHVNTSNGAYDVPGDEEEVTLLMWASLPDEPAEIPAPEEAPEASVKNKGQTTVFVVHHKASNGPDALTSPNTRQPPDWLGHIEAE